ncbi:putative F-box/FBD/LRR-repeat protein At1g78760 [Solanum lycopersicum]|uniref:putative F-box/FBD/LRR-repeat protein At1g78760 n=1 Tax=Solanum lycopersicum TaxID=4081 RepID=UPI000532ED18|nr:putative F-box/FBD/LRR-repeat protein At1g78760 [Solanum lycopersicum]
MSIEDLPEDIISNLPIGLIGEIHSHLPWKEVVKTSILSKKWRSIWYSHPIIWLDETDFGADYTNYSSTDKPRRDAFFTHMMELLEIRERNSELDYSVNKLFLRMTLEYDPSAEHLVNKWISFALEKKVRMICLGLKKINRTPYYLRGIAFSGTELVGLTISDCHITNCSFNLPALKLLFLFAVCIKDHDFKDLIAACPRIEKLRVLDTRQLHTIVVSNPHLKFFGGNLSCSNGKIRIESAEFDSLEFSFTKYACKVEITSATTVRELTVGNANNQEALMHLINKFPLLEKLIIHDCSRLQNLHISQRNLASLVLMDCTVVQLVRLTTPKLKSLEYKGPHTNFEGIEDLEELEFVLLYLEPVDMDTYWWYKWLRDILKLCARSKHLSVICNSQKVIIIPEYLRHLVSITDMEHLELEIKTLDATFKEVTDELISILPDLKTLSLTLGSTTKFFQIRIDEDGDLSAEEEEHNPKPNRRVSILRSMISKQIGE